MGPIRTILLFPLMMTPVVAGVLWRNLYHSQYGVINHLIGLVGIPPQTWLGNPNQALPAVITVEIWQQLPVAAFVLAAGLASLPVDMYKAAAVDGASTLADVSHDHPAAAQAGDPGGAAAAHHGRLQSLRHRLHADLRRPRPT